MQLINYTKPPTYVAVGNNELLLMPQSAEREWSFL